MFDKYQYINQIRKENAMCKVMKGIIIIAVICWIALAGCNNKTGEKTNITEEPTICTESTMDIATSTYSVDDVIDAQIEKTVPYEEDESSLYENDLTEDADGEIRNTEDINDTPNTTITTEPYEDTQENVSIPNMGDLIP